MSPVPRLSAIVSAALVASGLAIVTASTPAYAAAGPGAGFVWASSPSSPLNVAYTPSATYSYNSTSPFAPINTVTRRGTGSYEVKFPGLSSAGLPHVTAYGTDNVHCSPAGSITTDLMILVVKCVNPAGNLVDHRFTASYTNVSQSWQSRPMAYAFIDGYAGQIAPLLANMNSTGGSNALVKNGEGNYNLILPGLGQATGHVEVSAWWGFNRGEQCKTGGWSSFQGTDTIVNVLCFKNGVPADSYVVVTFVDTLNILGLSTGFTPDGHSSAYAWANEPTSSSYQPNTFYQFADGSTTAATITNTAVGAYTVQFAGVNLNNGNVQVTAYGSGTEYCGVASWSSSGIRVRCFSYDGQPVDTYFDVAFTGPFTIG